MNLFVQYFLTHDFCFQFQKEPLEEGGAGVRGRGGRRAGIFGMVSRIFLQAFTLTFLAEWGDRSQIATVVMAAREVSIFVFL